MALISDSVYYAEYEGAMIRHDKINISQERQKRCCEAQALEYISPSHRVILSDGNKTIKAAAVFFLDGVIWDAVLSSYRTMSFKRDLYKNHKYTLSPEKVEDFFHGFNESNQTTRLDSTIS